MKPAFYFVLLKPYSTHVYFYFLQAILQNVKVSSYALPICIRKCHFSGLTITQSKEPVTCTQHCEEMSLLHAGVYWVPWYCINEAGFLPCFINLTQTILNTCLFYFKLFFLQAILQNVKVSSYALPICIRKCHFSGLTITQSKEPVTCTQHCEEMSLLHAGVIQYLSTQYCLYHPRVNVFTLGSTSVIPLGWYNSHTH